MVCQKTFTSRFLIFLMSFIFVFMPIRVNAASNTYSGNLSLYGANPRILLSSGISVDDYIEGNNVVHYVGTMPNMVGFTQVEGVTYNGYAKLSEDYNLAGAIPSTVTKSIPNIFLSDYTNNSGISIVPQFILYDSSHVRLIYYIQFDNYTASYTGTKYIGFNVNMEQTLYASDQALFGYKSLEYTRTVSSDWSGLLYEYVLIEDSPGYEGTVTNQNQTIINQSQTQIQNQQEQIQQQEQANQLHQESNEQNKNFMDNFFSNLGNTVLGWIVPSSEQITDFFNEVNSWFSERLGFVWYPFDLAIQLVSAFAGGTADTGFVIPAFSLNFQGQRLNIWNSFEVDIDAFGIFQYVRFFTSALLVCGIVKMAIDKWDEWIGGHNQ